MTQHQYTTTVRASSDLSNYTYEARITYEALESAEHGIALIDTVYRLLSYAIREDQKPSWMPMEQGLREFCGIVESSQSLAFKLNKDLERIAEEEESHEQP